jgi:3'-5' exoribonuclease
VRFPSVSGPRLADVAAIAELDEDRIVEGTYAVARKQRLRTRAGASYLALELVDPSGRIDARVWNDVEMLDTRFAEGDAIKVLGRVERFRDRLQLEVRTLEPSSEVDPASLSRRLARDIDELDGFLEFLAGELHHPGLVRIVESFVSDSEIRDALRSLPATPDGHHCYAGGLLEHTVGVATICRETAQLHPRLRADLLLASALLHDLGRTVELGRGPAFQPTPEGRLLGHVHLGLRLIEERARCLEPETRTELLHAVAAHHDTRAARTAEAAVLYHANQLDAVAATRPVSDRYGEAATRSSADSQRSRTSLQA